MRIDIITCFLILRKFYFILLNFNNLNFSKNIFIFTITIFFIYLKTFIYIYIGKYIYIIYNIYIYEYIYIYIYIYILEYMFGRTCIYHICILNIKKKNFILITINI